MQFLPPQPIAKVGHHLDLTAGETDIFMKRSEMIQKMLDTSAEFHGESIHSENFELRYIQAMLETVEANGMLPPARMEKHMINETYFVHEWEQE